MNSRGIFPASTKFSSRYKSSSLFFDFFIYQEETGRTTQTLIMVSAGS